MVSHRTPLFILWYNKLHVGILSMDQTLKMLGMTSMFVGGFTALILDNLIPGVTSVKPVYSWLYADRSCCWCCWFPSVQYSAQTILQQSLVTICYS